MNAIENVPNLCKLEEEARYDPKKPRTQIFSVLSGRCTNARGSNTNMFIKAGPVSYNLLIDALFSSVLISITSLLFQHETKCTSSFILVNLVSKHVTIVSSSEHLTIHYRN